MPDTLSEYQFAGLLRGAPGRAGPRPRPQPLMVPAEAEIVIEGEVLLDDYRDEGPYGDHTGYYNSVEQFPGLQRHRHHHAARPDLSYHLHRPAAGRALVLGEALNEVFVPLLRQQFPEIVDFWLPPEGCSYRIAVVSMKKAYPGHAKRVMMAVWSYLRQFMYTKWVIVVDDDIDARDWKDVMWAISTRMDPARDITVIENTPIDYLDFASPESGLGSKIGLDATNKLPPETHREWGRQIAHGRGGDRDGHARSGRGWAFRRGSLKVDLARGTRKAWKTPSTYRRTPPRYGSGCFCCSCWSCRCWWCDSAPNTT